MGVAPMLLVMSAAIPAYASDSAALAISANIQARHLPFGTILDPIYASPTSTQIVGYTRCGDSALWTGAYLAAESYRYGATHSADALANAKMALAGLKSLADVTGTNLLARCIVNASSPYAQGIQSEESGNGVYKAPPWFWVGNTSRDEFVGAIFGLGAAYDLIDDPPTRTAIADLITRLTGFLSGHAWSIVMPDGTITTTFLIRPDEMLAILQVARHVNPSRFQDEYDMQNFLFGGTVPVPLAVDVASDDSYFKFNLAYMTFYNLLRLNSGATDGSYRAGYDLLRNHTAPQQNAFFNAVDRALFGINTARDAETRSLLQQWLQRPTRDPYTDASKAVANCGNQACQPVPLLLRPPTDFLWQRTPYQLTGGGSGIIEGPGIDYILPYWMSRYYAVIGTEAVSSSAAASDAVAPASYASVYGSGFPANPTVTVVDALGVSRSADVNFSNATQVNFLVPAATAIGYASVNVAGQSFQVQVLAVVPTLFSANGTGTGVAAATAIQVQAGNPQLRGDLPVFQCTASQGCVSVPLTLGIDTPIYLTLYGTGIRARSALANVKVTIDGVPVQVFYAGPQGGFPGLDQINVLLPLNLRGAGESNVMVTVDGQTSNTVTVQVR
jgi:uncharacterized protein (TIGR03437 family)